MYVQITRTSLLDQQVFYVLEMHNNLSSFTSKRIGVLEVSSRHQFSFSLSLTHACSRSSSFSYSCSHPPSLLLSSLSCPPFLSPFISPSLSSLSCPPSLPLVLILSLPLSISTLLVFHSLSLPLSFSCPHSLSRPSLLHAFLSSPSSLCIPNKLEVKVASIQGYLAPLY